MNRDVALDALREALTALEAGDSARCLLCIAKARVNLTLMAPPKAMPAPLTSDAPPTHWQDKE